MNNLLRLLLAAVALALPYSSAQAQVPAFDRAVACGGSPDGADWGPQHLAFDGQGNTLVAGMFSGTALLGSTALTAAGTGGGPSNPAPPDVFVAKLDAAGAYVWAAHLSGTLWETVTGIAVDAAGDAYVTGSFESYSVRFGTGLTLFNSSAAGEAYVAKLSGATGQWLWARRCGGTGPDQLQAVAVTAAGEVCLAGRSGSVGADFGPYTLPLAQFRYGFLAKLSAAGTWLWVRKTADNYYFELAGMVLDGAGSIYLGGSFSAPSLAFGATVLTAQIPVGSGSGGQDVFVAKYTPVGTLAWATQGEPNGANLTYNFGLALDGLGHLYTVGSYAAQSARLGPTLLPNLCPPYTPPGAPLGRVAYKPNGYVARLNAATGAWDWAVRAGGPTGDNVMTVAADGQGRVYVAGYYDYGFANPLPGGGRVGLAQLDGATGAWRWARPQVPGVAVERLAVDGAGRVAVGGWFSSPTATFGPATLAQAHAPGGTTGYLARMGAGPLAAAGAAPRAAALDIWPNPSGAGLIRVQGPAAGEAVQVLDALGRAVTVGHMPARGPLELRLPATLPGGVYVVRSAGLARRLVVE